MQERKCFKIIYNTIFTYHAAFSLMLQGCSFIAPLTLCLKAQNRLYTTLTLFFFGSRFFHLFFFNLWFHFPWDTRIPHRRQDEAYAMARFVQNFLYVFVMCMRTPR